jgi:hypothetical protein
MAEKHGTEKHGTAKNAKIMHRTYTIESLFASCLLRDGFLATFAN